MNGSGRPRGERGRSVKFYLLLEGETSRAKTIIYARCGCIRSRAGGTGDGRRPATGRDHPKPTRSIAECSRESNAASAARVGLDANKWTRRLLNERARLSGGADQSESSSARGTQPDLLRRGSGWFHSSSAQCRPFGGPSGDARAASADHARVSVHAVAGGKRPGTERVHGSGCTARRVAALAERSHAATRSSDRCSGRL